MMNDELSEWLAERLAPLEAKDETRAYIVGVFNDFRRGEGRDLSDQSVVLTYSQAVITGDFRGFQLVGDWSLWSSSYAPESITEPDVVFDLGMRSYGACDRLLRGTWPAFNELASRLPQLVASVHRLISVAPRP